MLLRRVIDRLEDWLTKALLQREARKLMDKFCAQYLDVVEQGIPLDPEKVLAANRAQYFHIHRMVAVWLLLPIAALGILSLMGEEYFDASGRAALQVLTVISVFWVAVFSVRAGETYRNRNYFHKQGADSRLFYTCRIFLRMWGDLNPVVQRFIKNNSLLTSFSMFEFELVETYMRIHHAGDIYPPRRM
jgi:hypothetical protein